MLTARKLFTILKELLKEYDAHCSYKEWIYPNTHLANVRRFYNDLVFIFPTNCDDNYAVQLSTEQWGDFLRLVYNATLNLNPQVDSKEALSIFFVKLVDRLAFNNLLQLLRDISESNQRILLSQTFGHLMYLNIYSYELIVTLASHTETQILNTNHALELLMIFQGEFNPFNLRTPGSELNYLPLTNDMIQALSLHPNPTEFCHILRLLYTQNKLTNSHVSLFTDPQSAFLSSYLPILQDHNILTYENCMLLATYTTVFAIEDRHETLSNFLASLPDNKQRGFIIFVNNCIAEPALSTSGQTRLHFFSHAPVTQNPHNINIDDLPPDETMPYVLPPADHSRP